MAIIIGGLKGDTGVSIKGDTGQPGTAASKGDTGVGQKGDTGVSIKGDTGQPGAAASKGDTGVGQKGDTGVYTGLLSVATKTTGYTLQATDNLIIGNSATPFTFTLPAATGSGRIFYIKNINTGVVTVSLAGSTIDAEASQDLNQWDAMTIVDYATNKWVII